MTMQHGVSVNEIPTGVVPPVSVTAGLPVYIGNAPINLGDPTSVGKPVVCATLAAYVATFGPIPPPSTWGLWTLAEAAHAHFISYNVGPFVAINVIDPTNVAHRAQITGEAHTLATDGTATLQIYGEPLPTYGVIKSTVVVKVASVTKTIGTDYTLAFNDAGSLVVSRVSTGTIASGAHITADYEYLDPAGVVASDIIGGYSAGKYTGIAAVEQVFPATRLPPGILLAPTWSETPSVAAALISKAHLVNGAFRCVAAVDLSTNPADIPTAEDAPAWKNDHGYGQLDTFAGWPLSKNGSAVYHASTVFACLANLTDAANDGIPFVSPSNKAIVGDSAVLNDGSSVLLTLPQANALNAAGIVTLVNGFAGWRLWGNRTAAYPGTTDPKDAFIPIRRMFNWIESTIQLTTAARVDDPMNKRLIDGVIGTVQTWLNGLIAGPQALIAGKISFVAADNPITNLANGKIVWEITATPPSPAEAIVFQVQYDPTALAALFA